MPEPVLRIQSDLRYVASSAGFVSLPAFVKLLCVLILALMCCSSLDAAAANKADSSAANAEFFRLSQRAQKLKHDAIKLNRKAAAYLAKSQSPAAYIYQARNRAEYTYDLVLADAKKGAYLNAINRYHIGRDLGAIVSKYDYALRVANIYLDYGLYDYSSRLFNTLLGNDDSAVASTARYFMAKHNYLTGKTDEALKGFVSVVDGLPEDLLDQNKLYQGIIYQQRRQHKDAINVFSTVEKSSPLYVYAQFNIALSNLRQGWWADAENAMNNMVSVIQSTGEQNQHLIDRLYVALGYSQLQRQYFREAFESLDRVSKDGVFAYKALLGMGLVAAEQEQYEKALAIMEQLTESYSGLMVTEEAHLVIPFLLESIKDREKMLTYYSRAAKHYTSAIHTIDTLKKQVKKGRYDHEFIAPGYTADGIALEKPSPGEINRYLFELLENGQWRSAAREVADANEIIALSDDWLSKLSVVGNYQPKTFKRLKKLATGITAGAKKLQADVKRYLRGRIIEHLDERKQYFKSYMAQSKFALARSLDFALGAETEVSIGSFTVNEKAVRNSYQDYVDSSDKQSVNRRAALVRLAELYLEYREKLLAEDSNAKKASAKAVAMLDSSIKLLNIVLEDYPDHEKNDQVLYQLIKAHDLKDDRENVLVAMRQLVDNYSHSRFFTEIQFKLGEQYLTGDESIDAELAYSAALVRGNDGSDFYRRALYKRGWSRLRQSLYDDALEDFFDVIALAGYENRASLSTAEQAIFDDLLRGITLCFENRGGLESLNSYYARNHDAPFADLVYEALAQSYVLQKRLQDSVDVYSSYIERYSMQPRAPEFQVRVIEIWKKHGYNKFEVAARETFDKAYGMDSHFWQKNDRKAYTNIVDAIKANILFMSSMYHSRYQKKKKPADLDNAKRWYQRFMASFDGDPAAQKTHFLYAELLSESGDLNAALQHYDKASKIKDKNRKNAEAAYARILTADTLIKTKKDEREKWVAQKIDYSLEFSRNYPGDKRVPLVLLNAMEEQFEQKAYKAVLDSQKLFPNAAPPRLRAKAELLKAHSLFALESYADAEIIYAKLSKSQQLKDKEKHKVSEQLASAIYKQGELASQGGDIDRAVSHFKRVAHVAPQSSVTPSARYDAATLLIKQEKINDAIPILETFKNKHPTHKLYRDVMTKLALLYMDSDDQGKSAEAFEFIAGSQSVSAEERKNALWQSAELNKKLGNVDKARSLFNEYLTKYPQPYDDAMEAMAQLVELYGHSKDSKTQNYWRTKIIGLEKSGKVQSTDRTRYLAAHAALGLADVDFNYFQSVQIKPPLKTTLVKKKNAMQRAIDSLSSVANYSIEETSTKATYQIAQVYQSFSKALINSPRPKGLKGLELEQYSILLEEQAFPFEEKAIAFHESNVELVKNGVFNEWVGFSLEQLSKLLPAVYDKQDKLEPFIE